MKVNSKLIYQSDNTCFQTFLPVYFYGMPDGKMLVVFTRFKNENPLDTMQEWIVAQHLDYYYDFSTDKIISSGNQEIDINEFMDLADNLEQRIRPLEWFGSFYTNHEAQIYFNQNKNLMLNKIKTVEVEVDEYLSAIEI